MPLCLWYLTIYIQCVPQPALARTQRRRRCALGFLPAPGKIGKHENVLLQRNKSITVRPGYCAPYRSRSPRVPIIIGKPVAAWRVILVRPALLPRRRFGHRIATRRCLTRAKGLGLNCSNRRRRGDLAPMRPPFQSCPCQSMRMALARPALLGP